MHEDFTPSCHCTVTECQFINSCIATPPPITVFTCISNVAVSCSYNYKCEDLLEIATGMELRGEAGSFCVWKHVFLCVDKLEFHLGSFLDNFPPQKVKRMSVDIDTHPSRPV